MSDKRDLSSASTFGTADDSEFGRLVIRYNLATAEEVKKCMSLLKRPDDTQRGKDLGELLVDQGSITNAQAERIRAELGRQPTRQQIPGYQILDKVGKGAMATVYKARQISLDRIVAIKILPKRYSESAEFVDRFYREGKAAAKLNHANIAQAIDVGESGGYHYFVMEFVDGQTVHDILAERHHYSEYDGLKVIIQMADALSHAHSRGLVHRDVKPKNIMINRDGIAKLTDMGLAREVSDRRLAESEAGRTYGTPYYISPEQVRGDVDIDFRADVYSLGATFYHMVAGQVPFDAGNPTAVMLKHLRERLVPPDHVNPEISIGCAEIIEVMMAKRREDRYASTGDLLDDLRAVHEGQPPIHARAIFDVGDLARLENGRVVTSDGDVHPSVSNSQVAMWKTVTLVMILLLFLSVVVNIALMFG